MLTVTMLARRYFLTYRYVRTGGAASGGGSDEGRVPAPGYARTDEKRLLQVLSNLIGQGWRRTESGTLAVFGDGEVASSGKHPR